MSGIIPSAEPFFFPGQPGRPGCLLIHGFTGTPKEMRGLGQHLARLGYPSLGVRLAGHATRPKDMIRSRWQDWAASVEDGYRQLQGLTSRIYMIGLSAGGALALVHAPRLPAIAIVTISTPYAVPTRLPAWALMLLSRVVRYRRKSRGPAGTGWFDKAAFADHVSYPMNPVRSAAELKRLVHAMRHFLPQVRVPVLVIHSVDDAYVTPWNAGMLFDHLTNVPLKEKHMLARSGHVVTRDAARDEAFEVVADFLSRTDRQ